MTTIKVKIKRKDILGLVTQYPLTNDLQEICILNLPADQVEASRYGCVGCGETKEFTLSPPGFQPALVCGDCWIKKDAEIGKSNEEGQAEIARLRDETYRLRGVLLFLKTEMASELVSNHTPDQEGADRAIQTLKRMKEFVINALGSIPPGKPEPTGNPGKTEPSEEFPAVCAEINNEKCPRCGYFTVVPHFKECHDPNNKQSEFEYLADKISGLKKTIEAIVAAIEVDGRTLERKE